MYIYIYTCIYLPIYLSVYILLSSYLRVYALTYLFMHMGCLCIHRLPNIHLYSYHPKPEFSEYRAFKTL